MHKYLALTLIISTQLCFGSQVPSLPDLEAAQSQNDQDSIQTMWDRLYLNEQPKHIRTPDATRTKKYFNDLVHASKFEQAYVMLHNHGDSIPLNNEEINKLAHIVGHSIETERAKAQHCYQPGVPDEQSLRRQKIIGRTIKKVVIVSAVTCAGAGIAMVLNPQLSLQSPDSLIFITSGITTVTAEIAKCVLNRGNYMPNEGNKKRLLQLLKQKHEANNEQASS